MQMIEVIKRLAELDEANGGVKESTKMVQDPALAVVTESVGVSECGPMGMPGMSMPAGQPASFSINASAGSGDEVANMLTQIMTLAGVKKDAGPIDGPGMDKKEPLMAQPGSNDIKAAINAIDQVEKETDAIGGMDADSKPEMETDAIPGDEPADVGDMANDVRDMAGQLADTDKEDLGLEALDNSPEEKIVSKDPLNDFAYQLNKLRSFEYTPPNSGSNPLKAEGVETKEEAVKEDTQESLLSITNDLMKQYEAFKAQ